MYSFWNNITFLVGFRLFDCCWILFILKKSFFNFPRQISVRASGKTTFQQEFGCSLWSWFIQYLPFKISPISREAWTYFIIICVKCGYHTVIIMHFYSNYLPSRLEEDGALMSHCEHKLCNSSLSQRVKCSTVNPMSRLQMNRGSSTSGSAEVCTGPSRSSQRASGDHQQGKQSTGITGITPPCIGTVANKNLPRDIEWSSLALFIHLEEKKEKQTNKKKE